MADTAQARLERLLYVLPTAARNNGATLVELANALGVDPGTIVKDLREALERNDYHPGGSVESFTITLTRTRVRVHAPHDFNRPTRLSEREALALAIGLRTLAAEAEVSERQRILELAARLEQELQAPTYSMRPLSRLHDDERSSVVASVDMHVQVNDQIDVELDDDEVRGRIARAIEEGLLCALTYVKSGAREPELRRVKPQHLVYGTGEWYLAAHDYDRNDGRLFRLDRIIAIDLEPAGEDDAVIETRLPTGGYAYVGEQDGEQVSVRYSARIARWLAEHTAEQCDADGSLTLTHDVSDQRWLVRHVLRYGADAEVLEPTWARRLVQDAAERMAG